MLQDQTSQKKGAVYGGGLTSVLSVLGSYRLNVEKWACVRGRLSAQIWKLASSAQIWKLASNALLMTLS